MRPLHERQGERRCSPNKGTKRKSLRGSPHFIGLLLLGKSLEGRSDLSWEVKVPQDEKDGLLPILVIVDEKSGCVFSGVVAKGVNPYATGLVAEALRFCGRQKVIMMTDAENSIKALAESAA